MQCSGIQFGVVAVVFSLMISSSIGMPRCFRNDLKATHNIEKLVGTGKYVKTKK